MRSSSLHVWPVVLVLLAAGCVSALLAQSLDARQVPQQGPARQQPLIPQVAPVGKNETLYTADSSVRWALQDLEKIPADLQPYMRYLSLYNTPAKDRPAVARTISFVVHSLSTRRKPYIPSFVPGSDQTVVRINIKDYDWKDGVWEKLARKGSGVRAFPEPYFHAFIAELEPVKVTGTPAKVPRGVASFVAGCKIEVIVESAPIYAPGSANVALVFVGRGVQLEVLRTHERGLCLVKTEHGEGWIRQDQCQVVVQEVRDPVQLVPGKHKKFVHAPWLTPQAIGSLAILTKSESPIVRADWFIANAIVPPAYYDFLNLGKKVGDFEKLVFANEKTSAQNHLQDRGVVVHSSVARNNRTLTRSSTLTGGYIWVSHDSLTSVDDRKYIQNLLDEKFDAAEIIGTLPNGLQAYFVTDGKGNRVDFADPNIAIDNTAVDRIVRTGRSCMICHSDGIRPIDDEVRKITEFFRDAEQVRLLIPDERKAYRVQDLYGSNVAKQVWKDQQLYQDSVNEVTGLDMRQNATVLGEVYDKYAEFLLTKEVVQREVGLPLDQLEAFIRKSDDPIILGMIRTPIRPIRRDQWEESFQYLQSIILSAPRPGGPVSPQPNK